MDTPDTPVSIEVKKKRGRPAKQDPATPMGEYIKKTAETNRALKTKSQVVEKYYELTGKKLSLCKVKSTGSVFKIFVGSTDDQKNGPQLREFIAKLVKEGKLVHKI